jgi:hypothetical protein
MLPCCYPTNSHSPNDLGRKACYTHAFLPPKKNSPRSSPERLGWGSVPVRGERAVGAGVLGIGAGSAWWRGRAALGWALELEFWVGLGLLDVRVGFSPGGGEGGPWGDSLATFRRRVARNLPPRPGPTSQVSIGDTTQRSRPLGAGFSGRNVRRCPTLPRGLPRSTIGAEGLNFRVRDGTGCFPLAMAAATLWKYQP